MSRFEVHAALPDVGVIGAVDATRLRGRFGHPDLLTVAPILALTCLSFRNLSFAERTHIVTG